MYHIWGSIRTFIDDQSKGEQTNKYRNEGKSFSFLSKQKKLENCDNLKMELFIQKNKTWGKRLNVNREGYKERE